MYLSRILHKTETPHRLVMAGFPETDSPTPRADWGILYRVENPNCLLVQSEIAPDWSNALPPSSRFVTKEISPNYELGRKYHFWLTFNSVKRSQGRDVFVDPIDWLERRDLGGELSSEPIFCNTVRDISSKGHHVTLNCAHVSGIITITDLDRLMHVIRHGVGRGRAYGCGLMSVA